MPRRGLVLENLALRHQLMVLNRRVEQSHFHRADRLLWVALRSVWSRWTKALVIVQPQTVAVSPDFSHSALIRCHSVFEYLGCGRDRLERPG